MALKVAVRVRATGTLERGIQSVDQQVKVARRALEETWGLKISVKSTIWPQLTEYVALLLNRLEARHEGKTVYEMKGEVAKARIQTG